jgi:hypothetical protein
MLWTTSPSDDTRTIKIFCTLETMSAASRERRVDKMRWAILARHAPAGRIKKRRGPDGPRRFVLH